MDGELEGEEDREYLARFAARIAPPVSRVTVPESDHYANSRELWRTDLAVYDRVVVAETLRALSDWLGGVRPLPRAADSSGSAEP
jgi:hypothetical protein